MTLRLKMASCATAAVALAAPAAAHASSKDVSLGPPHTKAAAPLQKYSADVNAFFPKSITIHAGDSIRFLPNGFHNIHFLGKKGKNTGPIVPTGKTIAGAVDPAGQPYGFNGLPELTLNSALFNPAGKWGKTIITNGSKEIQSALPLSDKPKPMTIRFTKAGTFSYYCDLHAGMKGTVRVVSRRRPVLGLLAERKRVAAQVTSAIKVAKTLVAKTAAPNTVDLGRVGSGAVTLYSFAPAKLTVPVGTTVTFQSAAGDGEPHTATTGPGDAEKPSTFLGKLAASFDSPAVDQAALYPSDLGAPAALTPTLHGNGFWNGGAQDGSALTPLVSSSKVTFAAPGTYTFYCLIHPFMKGTITAQ